MSVGFLSFFIEAQISLPYKRMGNQLILENFFTKVGLKLLLRIPNILENFASFFNILFILIGNFTSERFKILYLS